MEAIILAGGLGTRLRSVVVDVPKPMAPVGDKPFLSYIFEQLLQYGITKVVLSVGYKNESVINHFGAEYKTISISYSIEDEPLGTGGAIARALEMVHDDNVLIINGDTYFDINLDELFTYHITGNRDITMSLKSMKSFDRYGTVVVDNDKVIAFEEKKYKENGLINGGIYVLRKKDFYSLKPETQKFSFENDFLQLYTNKLNIGFIISNGYFIDIGIPEDYVKAQIELIK